ncbi:lactonase family protein [Streptomyces sp. XM4193]|uniref:lactonase family protein n=1 Tax=Streptomyces sp. XM4193 TaxID=2929782 RepID=UPI001FF8B0A4|nr:lactonase family protein [Streptomyces sp. XM4193]MCK1797751.1 lactonase family protein [Streptomyces sp. XM4193]
MAGTGNGQWAYFGSFTADGGRGITTAAVDTESGALTVRGHCDEVVNPSYLTLAPGSAFLYSVSEQDEGAVAAYSLAEPGAPRLLGDGPVSVGASGPTHLTVAAGQLFTANYTSGSVTALPVRSDGSVGGAEPAVRRHSGSGPNADRQAGPHAHAVVADPRWHWLLSTDLGTDSVWVYRLDHTGAALIPHGQAELTAGGGPRHLAFHPAGEVVYVVSELGSTLTGCRWDGESGTLRPVRSVSTRAPGAHGENYPSALTLSADGSTAWVANRGDDTIAVFRLDPEEGGAELVGTVSCGGRWPRDLVLGPGGRHLYAANEVSGEVVWFDLDPVTGVPKRAGAVSAPAVSCVVFG